MTFLFFDLELGKLLWWGRKLPGKEIGFQYVRWEDTNMHGSCVCRKGSME
jgi:hypothetical protein